MTGTDTACTLDHGIVFVRDLFAGEQAFAERLGLVRSRGPWRSAESG